MDDGNQENQISDDNIIEILNQFDWNWYIAADYLDRDPAELRAKFESRQPNSDLPQKDPATFDGAQIHPANLAKLQNFIRENLKGPLPLLFDQEITNERKSAIASDVLLEKGLPYRLTHMKEYIETYEVLEKEALSLAQWREQNEYLTLVEEALFKISARLAQKEKIPNPQENDNNSNNGNSNNNSNKDDEKDEINEENQDDDGFL
ncbi:hypothetical protein M9Y10_012956 [Tritrichomonas musculus]|uniref:Uncharacterized protein n=1 Tax=Tritrichomonas musculus TaxID=1915356 RepID=A0ABR2I5W7_9EUKA